MLIRTATAAVFLIAASVSAATTTLYDGSLGTSPTAQGMTYIPLGAASTVTAGGTTTLDTSASNSIYAGFGTNGITLDRTAGFSLRLDARLVSEAIDNANRAAFSLLVVTSDLRAIELGFQTSRIFAQADSPLFTAAEATTDFNPTFAHRYDLDVSGSAYSLRADGNIILTGALRDYTAFPGLSVGPFVLDPYEMPNSLFIGDNTTSAGGVASFSYVSVTVPEPTTIAAFASLSLIAVRRRR